MKLYTKVPIKDCIARIGKQPIAVRWTDVNKQDMANPLYRPRFVGKEFNVHDDISVYAAIPPIQAVYSVMTNDISHAYFYTPVQEGQHIYVQLPAEDMLPGEEDVCGRLNFSMCGTRRAASNWQAHYTNVLKKVGFTVGVANNCTFYHPRKLIQCMPTR